MRTGGSGGGAASGGSTGGGGASGGGGVLRLPLDSSSHPCPSNSGTSDGPDYGNPLGTTVAALGSSLTGGLWDGGSYKNNPGFGESRAAWTVAECTLGALKAGPALIKAGLNGGENSVFWSGYNYGAQAEAQALGNTIESTPIGSAMNWVQSQVPLPRSAWDWASDIFAKNAKGPVIAVLRGPVGSDSTWTRVEMPIIARNGNPVTWM